ncbi:MAG: DUF2281 domain-containing protein [Bacteroidetes bacterium]|nr:MAG: DUF2281 domain-containing protein [Bacteroidota bacterium]
MTVAQKIISKINKLPPNLLMDLEEYVNKISKKRSSNRTKKLNQNWAGALKEFKTQYTSIELQKKALDWHTEQY